MSTQETQKQFEKIYNDTYNKTLKFIICKCSNIDDINDIIQETYVELYKTLKQEKNIENYQLFVIGIARNKIKKHYNLKNKIKVVSIFQKKDEEDSIIDIDSQINLEAEFITKENIEQIWKYIKLQNINTAKIFYLYFVLDMSFKEISEELQINESTIKSSLYRMLKRIKENFGGEK